VRAGVMLGFCGGGGTPLFAGTEAVLEVAWMQPQSEYRPTEYLQQWARFWFDDALRLSAAKAFQQARLDRVRQHWARSKTLKEQRFQPDLDALDVALTSTARAVVTS